MLLRQRSAAGFVSLLVACLVLLGCTASTEIVAREATADSDAADTAQTDSRDVDDADVVAAEGDASQGEASQGEASQADAQDAGAAELSSEDVYRQIQDSIVFVASPDGVSHGSGIVIEGGWIVTNAHVVDRNSSMRIGDAGGEDLGLQPVHAVDWIADLAVIGPITDLRLTPITPGASADLGLGSRVLLAGFPDEDGTAPTPTLTEGIVSRNRSFAFGDLSFLQVDATIAPGQSGGALVNGQGELVGISFLEFGVGEFGVAVASDEAWARIDALTEGSPTALPTTEPVFELTGEVGPLTRLSFLLEIDESGDLDMLVSGSADVFVDLQTLSGTTIDQSIPAADPFDGRTFDDRGFVDGRADGSETLAGVVEPGVYQVVIGSFGDTLTSVTVQSNAAMRMFNDAEEQATLPVGEIVEGQFDWTRDTDKWQLPLETGDQVSIRSDGIADTVMVVRLDDEVVAVSDDGGIGIFGTGSLVDFVADETGIYIVEIGSFDSTRWGYVIEATVN